MNKLTRIEWVSEWMSDRAPSDCLLSSWMLRHIHEQKRKIKLYPLSSDFQIVFPQVFHWKPQQTFVHIPSCYVTVNSKLKHRAWAYPGYLTPPPARERGNLITTHRGWGSLASIHVTSRADSTWVNKSWRRRRKQTLINWKEKIAYSWRIGWKPKVCTAPRAEMILKLDRKWSRTTDDPRCGPQMIPPENEEWHGVCSSGRGFNF